MWNYSWDEFSAENIDGPSFMSSIHLRWNEKAIKCSLLLSNRIEISFISVKSIDYHSQS